jgi:hypothetical protein
MNDAGGGALPPASYALPARSREPRNLARSERL